MNGATTLHPRFVKSSSDDWLTPPLLIERLGPFDLDPCASLQQRWPTAANHLTEDDDGLAHPWRGLVWLNPPYSKPAPWVERLANHPDGGMALVFARTETVWFQEHVWRRAQGILFIAGRLRFHRPSTGEQAAINAPAPSVLVSYGDTATERLRAASPLIGGHFAEVVS